MHHDARFVVSDVRYIQYNLVYVQFVILSLNLAWFPKNSEHILE